MRPTLVTNEKAGKREKVASVLCELALLYNHEARQLNEDAVFIWSYKTLAITQNFKKTKGNKTACDLLCPWFSECMDLKITYYKSLNYYNTYILLYVLFCTYWAISIKILKIRNLCPSVVLLWSLVLHLLQRWLLFKECDQIRKCYATCEVW